MVNAKGTLQLQKKNLSHRALSSTLLGNKKKKSFIITDFVNDELLLDLTPMKAPSTASPSGLFAASERLAYLAL